MSIRPLVPTRLVLATHNSGKVREMAALLVPLGVDVISAGELGLPEPPEDGGSFAANAFIKARSAAEGSGQLALADDSGLCVEALGGAPGVYTADWAGVPRDWTAAMRRVEDALRALGPSVSRVARFHCTLALAWPDGEAALFDGEVLGRLVWPPRGERGFGYDPVFVAEGHAETFGEMDPDAKHAISHRARAFEKLAAACLL